MMAVYLYRGTDAMSATVQGSVIADSPRQARDQLRSQGIAVQTMQSNRDLHPRLGSWFAFYRARVQWTQACHELSMLLRAGIPLTESLDTLAEQHRGGLRSALSRVRDRVASGASFAAAMSELPQVFDTTTVRLVEVGESAGTLETVLEQLSDYKSRMSKLGDKVFTAMLYPAFLFCFGSGAMIFLMTWVLPPLLENLKETVPVLPWPTRIAKAMSDTVVQYGVWIAVAAAVLLVLVVMAIRSEAGSRRIDRWVLKLPGFGPMIVKQNVSRIAMIIGSLTRSGLTLPAAVELAVASTQNSALRAALQDAHREMASGKEIADSLERSGVFPPLVVRVFSVGRDTGKLEDMLTRLSDDYNQQLDVASARLTALVEPILILTMACFVGFLLLATILPILQAGNFQSK
jgi:general secretion pathway protein F